MSLLEQSVLGTLRRYYNDPQTVHKFSAWGADAKRPGVSAAHLGLDDVARFHRSIFRLPIEVLLHKRAVTRMTRRIIAELQVEDGQTILDAGCGTGAVAYPIAEQNRHSLVYCLNISRGQLSLMQQYQESAGVTNVYLSEQSYTRMAFSDASFNRVLFAESFCHAHDKEQTIREVARVLMPGGKALIVDSLYLRPPDRDEERASRALEEIEGLALTNLPTIDALVRLMEDTGLRADGLIDMSERVKPSLALIANGYMEALRAGRAAPSPIIDAYLALHALTQQGTLGYAFVRAAKV